MLSISSNPCVGNGIGGLDRVYQFSWLVKASVTHQSTILEEDISGFMPSDVTKHRLTLESA